VAGAAATTRNACAPETGLTCFAQRVVVFLAVGARVGGGVQRAPLASFGFTAFAVVAVAVLALRLCMHTCIDYHNKSGPDGLEPAYNHPTRARGRTPGAHAPAA
jgi:hypothetical protein